MTTRKKKPKNGEEIATSISLALQKLVAERLGSLQDSVLLGNRVIRKQEPETDEASYLRDNVMLPIQARVILEARDFEVSENFLLRIQLENLGKTQVSIARVYGLIPPDFEVVTLPDTCKLVNAFLDLHGMKLDPYASENIDVTLRPTRKGTFNVAPRIVFSDTLGIQMSSVPEPISLNVSETILPNRIKTGFQDLDSLLFGGIPKGFAVILTSVSCDERDLLVKRFLEAGAEEENTTILAIVDPEGARTLAEEFKDNFHILVCSPTMDDEYKRLFNVHKAAGVGNLTEINIALEKMLYDLSKPKKEGGRDCLEILSDVLLEHGAIQTRKWLSRLIPEFRSRGFTTLAVINPQMHSSEELHALLDLFDGEITIYEKGGNDFTKYLRIKKMQRQRYLENEIPLKKIRLMTTPLTLSCCRRAFNV
jgi:KaiC/GvpD/RAD55 family RecA-like ATPase